MTLGCSKNLVDSENMITQLQANDIQADHTENADANVIIVNTCGFIDAAKEESVETILAYAAAKEAGEIEKLYVTGCLSERYKEDLVKEIPEVDAFFGTMELLAILQQFDADYKHELIGKKTILSPSHYAYMKISEGCNRTCSFCAIPLMRKGHVSRPIEELVMEATHLAAQGVKEVMLIAQELTYYGLDLYKRRALKDLLKALVQVEGIDWIRLHYAYPNKFPVELFDVMAQEPKICNYLDVPLQHASDTVLQRMKRQTNRAELQSLIDYARAAVPNIALRTTMLVGFPGETEEEFAEMLDFVRANRFDRLGAFQYSHEEDTSAYLLEDDVPKAVKQARVNRLMEVQNEISLEINQAKVGQRFKVLIDRKEGNYFYGRTEFDSPEVDNEVLIPAQDTFVRVGDFALIEIVDALDYDLMGVLVD